MICPTRGWPDDGRWVGLWDGTRGGHFGSNPGPETPRTHSPTRDSVRTHPVSLRVLVDCGAPKDSLPMRLEPRSRQGS